MTDTSLDPIDWSSTGAAFTTVADRRPDHVALRWHDGGAPGELTYAQLLARARSVARAILVELDPGDRLAIWSTNCPEWVVAQLGAALAGVVLVPLNPALTDSEAQFIVATSGTRLVLTGRPWRGRDLAAAAARLRVSDRPVPVLPLTEWVAGAE